MKRTISNPHKVNFKMYIIIIIISLITLISSITIPNFEQPFLYNFLEIIKNLSYGCIASTIVALIIDCVNVKNLNKKANDTYDSIYAELKVSIGNFLGTWAEICAISFKKVDYYKETHSWNEWYEITKTNYDNLVQEKQEYLLNFFRNSLMQSGEYVNRALEKIASQTYVLTINNVMNNELHRIISDFKFEFYALDTDLSHDNYAKYFWDHMEAIAKDLNNYISQWSDISYYNSITFKPFDFFGLVKRNSEND